MDSLICHAHWPSPARQIEMPCARSSLRFQIYTMLASFPEIISPSQLSVHDGYITRTTNQLAKSSLFSHHNCHALQLPLVAGMCTGNHAALRSNRSCAERRFRVDRIRRHKDHIVTTFFSAHDEAKLRRHKPKIAHYIRHDIFDPVIGNSKDQVLMADPACSETCCWQSKGVS